MNKPLKLLLLLIFIGFKTNAQQAAAIDSIKQALAGAKTDAEKVYWLDNLSRTLMNVNLQEAEKYGKQLITLAEESRDRGLMIKAYMSNGLRCSYFGGQKMYLTQSISYYEKALSIARHDNLETETGAAQLRLAGVYLAVPDKEKALDYISQASSLIATLDNDSLKAEAHNGYGNVYVARNKKTLALIEYLNALRIAESTKQKIAKAELIRNCYLYLSSFYSGIEEYDKAIDYYTLAYKQLDQIKQKNAPYQRAIDMSNLGNLYAAKKNYDLAIDYYQRSIAIADSLKFSTLKIPAYISMLNQYLEMNQPTKALEFMNSSAGESLKKFLMGFKFDGVVDNAYAVIYSELGMLDSARTRFQNAMPYFEQQTSSNNRISFYAQLARFYKRTGEKDKAINYYLQVKELGEKNGSLDIVQRAAKHLDSLYGQMGNYQMASMYNGIYYQYKDSAEKINKEKELAQVEAADEQRRQARLVAELEEKKRRRNNIQYMGITIGIALCFIALVVLGMFKVSATTIKMIGFFAFIMFFEFIFLIFKKNIYSITHGEPWKDLLFMIGLAALLLPLHHWLEEKVIHYLTSHNRLTAAGHHLKRRLFRRSTEQQQ
ncbi:MAG TPA: tetratricopeptide repeat protein [Chitinophagaceae bacterium]